MAKTTKKVDDSRMKMLEELFGVGTIVKASDVQHDNVKDWCSTGSLTLDLATGGKGIPKGGKCTAILGRESASKTTLCMHIIAEEQKKGNFCAYLDVEDSIDLDYAKAIGVNLDLLDLVSREGLLKGLGVKDRHVVSGEEWLTALCKLLESNIYGIVVMDSVAALIPKSEIDAGLEGAQMSRIAAMMSKAYRAVNASLTVSKSGFVYTNQYRMNPSGYGNPYIEPAGEAWKYLQSLKIELGKKLDKDKTTKEVAGLFVEGSITKSKVCDPYKRFEYYVEFGKGIIRDREIFTLALEQGLIEKKGGWYAVEGVENQIQGEIGVLDYLTANPEFKQELFSKLKL